MMMMMMISDQCVFPVLVIIEKFTFRIPRIAQKVERFYRNIVEESLFGKDPDVTEV